MLAGEQDVARCWAIDRQVKVGEMFDAVEYAKTIQMPQSCYKLSILLLIINYLLYNYH